MPKMKHDAQVASALAAIMQLDNEQRIQLFEAMALAIETADSEPPEWHRPLVRKALAEHMANRGNARKSGGRQADIETALTRLRGA